MTQEITHAAPRAMSVLPAQATPADILLYAMDKGGNIEQIERLMDLQMRWDADQARKAYVSDMAEFKRNPPTIVKDKLVGYENKDGTFTGYKHATIGNVTNAIVAGLAVHGFSHAWEPEQRDGKIFVTCVITHKLGHSTRTTLDSVKDDSGKKNGIQQIASAITYLERYTLLMATGLATHDQPDDDGQAAAGETALADKWVGNANRAGNLSDLQAVWNEGCIILARDGVEVDLVEFKAAVNARKLALTTPATPGKSSRMADIIKKQPAPDAGAPWNDGATA